MSFDIHLSNSETLERLRLAPFLGGTFRTELSLGITVLPGIIECCGASKEKRPLHEEIAESAPRRVAPDRC
jgi:hypothetical protein